MSSNDQVYQQDSNNNGRWAAVPDDLKARDRWVCWRYEDGRNGKPTKVPYHPTDQNADGTARNASSTDSSTWVSFDVAREHADQFDGLGFALGDGFAGVDLDHCIPGESGEPERWAWKIINDLFSYSETSPSGTGVHVLLLANVPLGEGKQKKRGDGRAVELYGEGRYFTMTGNHLAGTPDTIERGQREVDGLLARLTNPAPAAPTRPAPAAPPSDLTDAEIIDKARAAKNGAEFSHLWDGDWKAEGYPSQSEADLALAGILAFWTGGDADRMDALFRQSALMRQTKWGRTNYRDPIIAKVLGGKTEFYSGGRREKASAAKATPAADVSTESDSTPHSQGVEWHGLDLWGNRSGPIVCVDDNHEADALLARCPSLRPTWCRQTTPGTFPAPTWCPKQEVILVPTADKTSRQRHAKLSHILYEEGARRVFLCDLWPSETDGQRITDWLAENPDADLEHHLLSIRRLVQSPDEEAATCDLSMVRQIETPEVNYLWAGWLHEKGLSVIGGDTGRAKSWNVIRTALAVRGQLPFPDGSPGLTPGRTVLYCETEGRGDEIEDRRRKTLGSDSPDPDFFLFRIPILRKATKTRPATEGPELEPLDLRDLRHRRWLEAAIRERRPAIVIIDTLPGALREGESKAEVIADALTYLSRVGEDFGTCVCVPHQLRKPILAGEDVESGVDAHCPSIHDLRGSSMVACLARTVLMCWYPEKELCRVELLKGAKEGLVFGIDLTDRTRPPVFLSDPPPKNAGAVLREKEVADVVIDYLETRSGSAPAGDVYQHCTNHDIPDSVLKKHTKSGSAAWLRGLRKRQQQAGGWVWHLEKPELSPDEPTADETPFDEGIFDGL